MSSRLPRRRSTGARPRDVAPTQARAQLRDAQTTPSATSLLLRQRHGPLGSSLESRTGGREQSPNSREYTPFDMSSKSINVMHPRASDASPTTKTLISVSNEMFRVRLATEDPFGSDHSMRALAVTCFKKAADDRELYARWRRFNGEQEYSTYIMRLVGFFDSVISIINTILLSRRSSSGHRSLGVK